MSSPKLLPVLLPNHPFWSEKRPQSLPYKVKKYGVYYCFTADCQIKPAEAKCDHGQKIDGEKIIWVLGSLEGTDRAYCRHALPLKLFSKRKKQKKESLFNRAGRGKDQKETE